MNTYSSPSRYRNCMSRLSKMACSTRTPALNVRSTTCPVRTFFSRLRTKAPPLPGLTCWKSTMVHRPLLSSSSVMPVLNSLVLMAGICTRLSLGGRDPAGDDLARVTGAEAHQILVVRPGDRVDAEPSAGRRLPDRSVVLVEHADGDDGDVEADGGWRPTPAQRDLGGL